MLGGTANATATAAGIFFPNANSFALTINGNAAQAQSTADPRGSFGGQAQATAQTNFGNFNSVQSKSTSPSSGAIPTAIAQAGGVVSPSNPIIAGQSFSVVSGAGFGPLTVANGSMGAGYGGVNGLVLTYQESASFTQNGGAFVLDLLSSNALGNGFDGALFTISLNSILIDSESFTDLASGRMWPNRPESCVEVVEATTMDLSRAHTGPATTRATVAAKTSRLRRVGMVLSSLCSSIAGGRRLRPAARRA
jgi:hypothetical protein